MSAEKILANHGIWPYQLPDREQLQNGYGWGFPAEWVERDWTLVYEPQTIHIADGDYTLEQVEGIMNEFKNQK